MEDPEINQDNLDHLFQGAMKYGKKENHPPSADTARLVQENARLNTDNTQLKMTVIALNTEIASLRARQKKEGGEELRLKLDKALQRAAQTEAALRVTLQRSETSKRLAELQGSVITTQNNLLKQRGLPTLTPRSVLVLEIANLFPGTSADLASALNRAVASSHPDTGIKSGSYQQITDKIDRLKRLPG